MDIKKYFSTNNYFTSGVRIHVLIKSLNSDFLFFCLFFYIQQFKVARIQLHHKCSDFLYWSRSKFCTLLRDDGSEDEEGMSQEDEEGDEEIRPTPSKKPRYTYFKSFRPFVMSFVFHLNSSISHWLSLAQELLPKNNQGFSCFPRIVNSLTESTTNQTFGFLD